MHIYINEEFTKIYTTLETRINNVNILGLRDIMLTFIITAFTDVSWVPDILVYFHPEPDFFGTQSNRILKKVSFNYETRVLGRVTSCGRTQFKKEWNWLNIFWILFTCLNCLNCLRWLGLFFYYTRSLVRYNELLFRGNL